MPAKHRPLSGRERQLVELAAHGLTDKEIAQRLGIRDGTVATYWERVRAKLGPHHRSELVAMTTQEASDDVVGRLQAEVERLEVALQHRDEERCLGQCAPEALLLIRADGSIVDLNLAAERLLGFDKCELIGQPFLRLAPTGAAQAYWQGFRKIVESAEFPVRARVFRVQFVDGQGVRRRVRLLASRCSHSGHTLVEISTLPVLDCAVR